MLSKIFEKYEGSRVRCGMLRQTDRKVDREDQAVQWTVYDRRHRKKPFRLRAKPVGYSEELGCISDNASSVLY
jgi:hypothetical protein